MSVFNETKKTDMLRRAFLVGAYTRKDSAQESEDLLKELEELVDTMRAASTGKLLVALRQWHPTFLVGRGKAEEIIELAKTNQANFIVFDNELTPGQQRNWEKLACMPVIDRQEVILNIFGQRAQTHEARLQIQLAQMEYSLPRLKRAWGHLGQQTGGIGTKGEGETQLELDKRMLRRKIEQIKKELVLVRQRRATQRKERQRVPIPNAAIVGYTNAGKSSLLRKLTDAEVLVEDKLFATLDPTTRKLELPNKQVLLLTDTVGFIRKLPHRLVEAFNATLEEALVANFLIHVVDVSQPNALHLRQETLNVLEELGGGNKVILTLFNKIDKIENSTLLLQLKLQFPEALFVSIKTGEGLKELQHRLIDFLEEKTETVEFAIPLARTDLVAQLYREAEVLKVHYDEKVTQIVANIKKRFLTRYQDYLLLMK